MGYTMDNKYYTPNIKEFHVGFEFESNYCLFNQDNSEEFKKVIMTDDVFDWFHSAYTQDAYTTEFRVKYLDKEDIESLGFSTDSRGDYSINNYYISWHTGSERPIWVVIANDNDIVFDGQLKNKSELKLLMNQLNIKYDTNIK